MPPASDSASAELPVRLPHTFRPFGVRMAVFVFGGLLVLVAAVVWFTFPPEIRDKFTTFQRGTVIVLGLGFLSIGWGLARSRVEARTEGLRVVNGYRSRRLDWNEVVRVSMKPGSPWAVLDLSDGTTAQALGIQASDGSRAARQVRELRGLVEALTHTDRDD
jgi:PH (Pleckstrin Homology) domain-containing protein